MSLLVYLREDDKLRSIEVPSDGKVSDLVEACGGPVMHQGTPLDPRCSLADSGLSNETTIEKAPEASCWKCPDASNETCRCIIRSDGKVLFWGGKSRYLRVNVINKYCPNTKLEDNEEYYDISEDQVVVYQNAVIENYRYNDERKYVRAPMLQIPPILDFINFADDYEIDVAYVVEVNNPSDDYNDWVYGDVYKFMHESDRYSGDDYI